MALVDCHMKGCKLRLHHVCQGLYVDIHDINLNGAELNICRDCVDDIWMGGKPDKLKNVQDSTVYSTIESDEGEE